MYLERFANCAQNVTVPDFRALSQKWGEEKSLLTKEIGTLSTRKGQFLPIEVDPLELLDAEINKRSKKVRKIEEQERTLPDLELREKLNQFPMLAMEPLTWRNEHGLPCFAVFALDNPNFSLKVSWNVAYKKEYYYGYAIVDEPHGLPSSIRNAFGHDERKLTKALFQMFGEMSTSKDPFLTAQFAGVIPPDCKGKIARAREQFPGRYQKGTFDLEIFIIAEVDEWKLEERVRPKGDPLIVGYHKRFPDSLWLIAAFDVTPMEQGFVLEGVQGRARKYLDKLRGGKCPS